MNYTIVLVSRRCNFAIVKFVRFLYKTKYYLKVTGRKNQLADFECFDTQLNSQN